MRTEAIDALSLLRIFIWISMGCSSEYGALAWRLKRLASIQVLRITFWDLNILKDIKAIQKTRKLRSLCRISLWSKLSFSLLRREEFECWSIILGSRFRHWHLNDVKLLLRLRLLSCLKHIILIYNVINKHILLQFFLFFLLLVAFFRNWLIT